MADLELTQVQRKFLKEPDVFRATRAGSEVSDVGLMTAGQG